MEKWVDQNTAVLASSVYCDNKLVARDASVTLPEVTFLTAEANAMGTMTTALPGLIEDMTMSIAKRGADKDFIEMMKPGTHDYETRFVQNRMSADGTSRAVGGKAFVTGTVNTIPGIGLEVGSASENEASITVTRYQLYLDGEEMLCIDRLAGICRILGKDYYSEIASLL